MTAWCRCIQCGAAAGEPCLPRCPSLSQAVLSQAVASILAERTAAARAAWDDLIEAVASVGMANATPEQLGGWADKLADLGAPYLAGALRAAAAAKRAERLEWPWLEQRCCRVD